MHQNALKSRPLASSRPSANATLASCSAAESEVSCPAFRLSFTKHVALTLYAWTVKTRHPTSRNRPCVGACQRRGLQDAPPTKSQNPSGRVQWSPLTWQRVLPAGAWKIISKGSSLRFGRLSLYDRMEASMSRRSLFDVRCLAAGG